MNDINTNKTKNTEAASQREMSCYDVAEIKVEKVKGISPDFHDGIGPSETVTLGLNIDGTFVSFGRYYFGPCMEDKHSDIFRKMEKFIDECVKRFSS